MTISNIPRLFILLLFVGCQPKQQAQTADTFETMSLLGDSLFRLPLPTETEKVYKRNLSDTRMEAKAHPDSEIALIWYGRRLAYLGYYHKAIEVYTQALEKFPESYKLLRHRGHRYITLRKFNRAVADLSRAAVLAAGSPDEIEPDGIPNSLDQPLTTTQWNIYYHLGLAHYLLGDWALAKEAFEVCLSIGSNDDVLVAASDWLYMIHRKLGYDSLNNTVLNNIPPNPTIIENDSYFKRIQMYSGKLTPDKLLSGDQAKTVNSLAVATQGYGVGNWYLSQGDTTRALEIFQIVLQSGNWPAFGYIATEAEIQRLTSNDPL